MTTRGDAVGRRTTNAGTTKGDSETTLTFSTPGLTTTDKREGGGTTETTASMKTLDSDQCGKVRKTTSGTTTQRCYMTEDKNCSNHNIKLERRKERVKYWGETKGGIMKWKYRLVDSLYCKCSGFKALLKPDQGENQCEDDIHDNPSL